MAASILCFNRVSGDFGVASFCSPSDALAFHAGWNGAVLSMTEAHPLYVYGGIEALNNGVHPLHALHKLGAQDAVLSQRQVAIIDSFGRIGVHSGRGCLGASYNTSRDGRWCICTIASNSHPELATEMLVAFQKKGSRTEDCLLAGLFAAHEPGHRRTASITVISGATGNRMVDFTVHDDIEALFKLCVLLLGPSNTKGIMHNKAPNAAQAIG